MRAVNTAKARTNDELIRILKGVAWLIYSVNGTNNTSPHGPYEVGYTCATMDCTRQNYPRSDRYLCHRVLEGGIASNRRSDMLR